MSYKLSHKVNLPPVDDKIVRTIALITNHKTGLYWASDAYLAKQAMCTVSLAKQVRRYCERIGVLKPTGKIHKCSNGFGGTKEYIFDPEPIKLYSVWSRIRLDRPDHSGKRYGDGGPVAARTLPAGSREVATNPEKQSTSVLKPAPHTTDATRVLTPCAEGLGVDVCGDVQHKTATAVAAADFEHSPFSTEVNPENQPQEQQPKPRGSAPNPAEDFSSSGPPRGMEPAKAGEDSAAAPPLSREGDPARWLAHYLHRYVAVRDDVAVTVHAWERLWTEDFRKLLSDYSLDQIELMIRVSQWCKTPTYSARGILAFADKLLQMGAALSLIEYACPYCDALFVSADRLVDHAFQHDISGDPADLLEEEFEYVMEDLQGGWDMYYPDDEVWPTKELAIPVSNIEADNQYPDSIQKQCGVVAAESQSQLPLSSDSSPSTGERSKTCTGSMISPSTTLVLQEPQTKSFIPKLSAPPKPRCKHGHFEDGCMDCALADATCEHGNPMAGKCPKCDADWADGSTS